MITNLNSMMKKRFSIKREQLNSNDTRYSSIASNSLLYLGVLVLIIALIIALIYMIVNSAKADTIISIWLPFMIAGVFMVFMSQLIRNYH